MSLVFHSRRSGSVSSLFFAALRQVLIAGAAVLGVMAITGCSRAPAQAGGALPGPLATGDRYGTNPPRTPGASGVYADPLHPSLKAQTPKVIFETPGRGESPLPGSKPMAIRPGTPRPDEPQYATPGELQKSSELSIASLINAATTPGPMPAYHRGGNGVLDEADRAVAPLTDTLAAIDAGQRAIVDNLRNADVPGFKVIRTAVGDGRDVATQLDSSQGQFQITERALDIAVQGEGFLPVRIYTDKNREGAIAYTRNGKLYMNAAGDIVVGALEGYQLLPAIKFPPGVTQVTIGLDGRLQVLVAGSDQPKDIGQISLCVFADPTALRPLGGGLYAETEASGQGLELNPGTRGAGRILQGQVESSNVDLLRERTRLKFLQNWRASIISALDGTTKVEGR